MNLVDDEDGVAARLGNDAHLLDQGADVVHRVIRRGVELVDVERTVLVEAAARFARVAGLGTVRTLAVDRLGEDAGTSRLAHSARTAEEVGMCQLTPLDGVLEGRGDVLLPDHRREGRGAVFAGTDDKVLHTADKYTKYNSM